MEYKNPKIPEGINISDENPLKDFFAMLLGISLVTALIIMMLMYLAETMVRYIPFEVELKLTENFPQLSNIEETPQTQRIENYLQELADELSLAQQLPKEMKITVHYLDVDEINAFATLGGNVVIFRGLLDKMPNENALAMVLAHEIAHIKHRDPIVALGRGLTVSLAIMSLMGAGDSGFSEQLVSNISLMTVLNFSREQEKEADHQALLTLQQYYGHVNGAEEIFKLFMHSEKEHSTPLFLSTHPQSKERLESVEEFSQQCESEPCEKIEHKDLRPLPDWISSH